MCDLKYHIGDGPISGWKIVAEKEGKYYSAAMGFCYNDHDKIPVIKKQKRISFNFSDNILSVDDLAFAPEMKGRSAIFRDYSAAVQSAEYHNRLPIDFTLEIVKATVENDVMEGEYGSNGKKDIVIYAGRKLTFNRKEVK